jgi:hypothetical protein
LALHQCPDCAHQCSTLARSCPNCGRPFFAVGSVPQERKQVDQPSLIADTSAAIRSALSPPSLRTRIILAIVVGLLAITAVPILMFQGSSDEIEATIKVKEEAEAAARQFVANSDSVRKYTDTVAPLTATQATARLDRAERLFQRKAPLDSIAALLDFAVTGATPAIIDRRQSIHTNVELRRQSQVAAQLRSESQRAASAAAPASDAGYQSLIANIWPGKKLYLRADKTFIGTIVTAATDHVFEDGTQRDAVLIRFKDGTDDWLPRETVKRIYVTRP